ncbi:MAG: anaerobic sulfatase maturase [Lachnospiraceae bacterium]|nr:anaerobic sulfatase maturase [Lachnospiraceae bacterium]
MQFVVMVKPIGSVCNMRCKYCYYLEKGQFSTHEKQKVMSYGLLEKIIKETIAASDGPVVSFVWHGGEPTLAGLDFYKRAVEFELKYLPKGWQVWNNLQTNGLALDEKWCAFLAKAKFDVGLSVDGGKDTHDVNRKDVSGNDTYEKIAKNVALLRKYSINYDLLCTVNSVTSKDPVGVYNSLKALGSGWIQFIPILNRVNDTYTEDSVKPAEYGTFLNAVFDEWVAHDLGKLDVQLFAETAKQLAGGQSSLCTLSPTCGAALIVEEDGGIYSCDHFVDDAHRLGYLKDTRFKDLIEGDAQAKFGLSKRELLCETCKKCQYLNLCNGGCLKDRVNGKNALCEAYKAFYDHSVPILKHIIELSSKGLSPEKIMEELK